MGINIKNPETERLIRELVELTGQGQTEAITNAVREKLAREREGFVGAPSGQARETGPLFEPPFDTVEHGEPLYDEKGLPK